MLPDSQPRVSRVFDISVLAAAVALLLGTAQIAGFTEVSGGAFPLAVWLCVPLIAVFARYPVHLDRPAGAIEISIDSCVLAYLGTTMDEPHQAVLVWAVGAVAAQCVDHRRMAARLFNIGVMIVSGVVALWLMDVLIGRYATRETSLEEFLAVMVGCAVYVLLDLVISEISVALENGAPIRLWGEAGVLISMVSVIAVDSLGYLAAAIQRGLPTGAMLLLGVPLLTLLIAARSTTRDRERTRRMRVLFDVSRSVQSQTSTADVLRLLLPGARELIRVPQTRLGTLPPVQGEVGARVTDGTQDWWLVAPKWSRLRATIESDAEHLDQLALAGSEALSRLKLAGEMTHLARHDPLTQLANRSVFLDRVEHALQMARRRRGRIAVLFCDLDGFKQVNDRFGHSGGDAVLVAVAGRIRACVRVSDTVARLGGDEFAILLEDVRHPESIDRVSTSVLAAVLEPVAVHDHTVTVSTSIGIATSDGADSGERVLRSADMAMYEAKALGKNGIARYQDELGTARVRKLEMMDALRKAVGTGDLRVVYQPIIEVHSGKTVGLEALARWQHGKDDIPPGQFMPLAEETGMVVPLGEHVLDIVARDVGAVPNLENLSSSGLNIGVNISAQQLRSPAFVDKVGATMDSLGGLALVLEVTERDVVREEPLSMRTMEQLVAAGVRLAVDDFGVGFSSIGYLQNLPVQILKTDQSFVASIDTSARAAELLRSMILMGQALGLDIVIEGVERQSQLDRLRQMGHHNIYAQGFLLGRPMTLPEAIASRAPRVPQPRAVT